MGALGRALLLFVLLPALAHADRVWELNGIRLEAGQVERLADDMAQRTVEAVESKLPALALREPQRARMLEIYRETALDVFDDVVVLVERADLDDAAKDAQIRELALAGQRRSHEQLLGVLDEAQLPLYSAWEDEQVEAFQSRRLDERRRRRRR